MPGHSPPEPVSALAVWTKYPAVFSSTATSVLARRRSPAVIAGAAIAGVLLFLPFFHQADDLSPDRQISEPPVEDDARRPSSADESRMVVSLVNPLAVLRISRPSPQVDQDRISHRGHLLARLAGVLPRLCAGGSVRGDPGGSARRQARRSSCDVAGAGALALCLAAWSVAVNRAGPSPLSRHQAAHLFRRSTRGCHLGQIDRSRAGGAFRPARCTNIWRTVRRWTTISGMSACW